MSELKIVEKLFKGRDFDREVIILCFAGISGSRSVCVTWWR
jgi:hypothetical protein